MAKAKKLEVKLTKSVIGEKPKNRATVRGLGLRKMQQTVEHNDTPAIRGMIHAVAHLVTVTEK
jgi:large subunit ribosomal protein L30